MSLYNYVSMVFLCSNSSLYVFDYALAPVLAFSLVFFVIILSVHYMLSLFLGNCSPLLFLFTTSIAHSLVSLSEFKCRLILSSRVQIYLRIPSTS
jgi:hypothetical protein